MAFIICITYLLLLLLIWHIVKDRVSKLLIFVYVSYWSISMFLCKINIFGYYEVSDDTYLFLLLHLFSFVIGFLLFKPKIHPQMYEKLNCQKIDNLISNKLFLSFYILCLCFIVVLFYRQRALLAVYTLSDMRNDFGDMILEGSGTAYLFYNIFAISMFHFALCLISYMFFFNRKWIYILFFSLYCLLWALVSGGRTQVMTFGYYILSMYIITDYIQSVDKGYKTKYKMTRRMKFLLISLISILVLSMSIVTFMKKSTGSLDKEAVIEGLSDLGMNLGEYSAGPIVAFDIGLHDKSFSRKKHYGSATFNGMDYLVCFVLRKCGQRPVQSYSTTTSILQNDIILIGPDRYWNYAYTSCMYYYFDFGIMGVILMPFFLGLISRFLITRLYKSVNIYNMAIFAYVCFCLYMSVFAGYLHKILTLPYIFILIVLSNRIAKREKRNDKFFNYYSN